ncbi:MAG: hypothetical protein LBB61_08175 [Treponema sp.]|nr:hypothetical protein [Treponema sp.]
MKYRAFGNHKGLDGISILNNSAMWTIANGIYGDADNSAGDTRQSVLNGGIVVRFGLFFGDRPG